MSRRVRLTCQSLEDRTTPTDIAWVEYTTAQADFNPVAAAPADGGGVWEIGGVVPQYPGQTWIDSYPSDPALVRLGPDGSPDPAFNGGKPLALPDVFRAGTYSSDGDKLFVAPDGKLIAVINATSLLVVGAPGFGPEVGSNVRTVVVRFNTDGTLDPTFGTNGVVGVEFQEPLSPPPNITVGGAWWSVAAADATFTPDGKIVLVANNLIFDPSGTPGSVTVVRLTADGQLDATFDGDGRQTIAFDILSFPGRDVTRYTTQSVSARNVEVGPDGSVWVGVSVTTRASIYGDDGSYVSTTFGSAVGVARLTPGGALDPTFDADGVAYVGYDPGSGTATSYLNDIALTPDGGVLLAGSALTKLTADGRPDSTFGTDGRLDPGDPAESYTGVVVLPDGRVRVAASEFTTYTSFVLGFLADGSPDPAFDPFRLAPEGSHTGTFLTDLTARPVGGLLVKGYNGHTSYYGIPPGGGAATEFVVPAEPLPWPDPSVPPVIDPPHQPDPSVTSDPYPLEPQVTEDPSLPEPPTEDDPILQTTADPAGVSVVRLTAPAVPAGQAPVVTVYNPDGSVRFTLDIFESTFAGGVAVALADVNGDGIDDVIASAGDGGGPRIKVFDGSTGAVLADFFAFDDSWRGGVSVAVADGNIVAGAGEGGGPRVRMFRGDGTPVLDFFAFDESWRGGITVAAGDMNWDGVADVAVGAGPGGGPVVKVYDGRTGALVNELLAGDPADRGGVTLAVIGGIGTTMPIMTAKTAGGVRAYDPITGTDLTLLYDPVAMGAAVG